MQNEVVVRGRRDLDLRFDPPPDLAIEVDVYASSLDRMTIHAALGVPEVWRWKDGRIAVHLRQADGCWSVSDRSACFPWLPMDELATWLDRGLGQDETRWIRAFRTWIRDSIELA